MYSKNLRAFARCQSGATVIEYALIAALISVASFAALSVLGTELSNPFDSVAVNIATAMSRN